MNFSLNFLPQEESAWWLRQKPVYLYVASIVLACLGGGLVYGDLHWLMKAQVTRANEIQSAMTAYQAQNEQVQKTAQAENASSTREQLIKQQATQLRYYRQLSTASSPGICLTQLKQTNKGMSLVGKVSSYARLARYRQQLTAKNDFVVRRVSDVHQLKRHAGLQFHLYLEPVT